MVDPYFDLLVSLGVFCLLGLWAKFKNTLTKVQDDSEQSIKVSTTTQPMELSEEAQEAQVQALDRAYNQGKEDMEQELNDTVYQNGYDDGVQSNQSLIQTLQEKLVDLEYRAMYGSANFEYLKGQNDKKVQHEFEEIRLNTEKQVAEIMAKHLDAKRTLNQQVERVQMQREDEWMMNVRIREKQKKVIESMKIKMEQLKSQWEKAKMMQKTILDERS